MHPPYTEGKKLIGLVVLVSSLLSAAGCAVTNGVTVTSRSIVEQQLLVRSLERAVAKLDTQRFSGKLVAIDLYALTGDREFAKEFITASLEEKGVRVAADPKKADLRLKVFASVLGVDRGENLIGTPSFAAPLVGLPIPEIALFKKVKHRGEAEVQIYAFDGSTGEFADKSPVGIGNAKYDEYTILIMIQFTLSDLDERADEIAQ
jgi:hypothetical protein